MRHAALITLLVASLWTASAGAQSSAPQSAPSLLDPAFAAMLLIAADNAAVSANPAAAAPDLDTSVTAAERRTVRRGRWLLATGIAVAATSALAGLTIGRKAYCEAHDDEVIDKTAPRVTSAVTGTFGLVLTGFGAVRFSSVPETRRRLTPASTGQRIGLVLASLGLSIASLSIVGVSALPALVPCWTT